LHPLRVESVAWATERRDVLSGLFFLLALDAYVRFHARREGIAWSALACYLASLLAKPVGMGLPLALVALDVYPLRRLTGAPRTWMRREVRGVWIEKIAARVGGANARGHRRAPAATFYAGSTIPAIGQAFYVLTFHLARTVVPVGLSPLYQLPVGWQFMRGDASPLDRICRRRRRDPVDAAPGVPACSPPPRYTWRCRAGPGAGGAAHHRRSLQLPGDARWVVVVAGAVLNLDSPPTPAAGRRLVHRRDRRRGVVMVVLGALTWRQIGVWHDSETLCYGGRGRRSVLRLPEQFGNALVRAGRTGRGAAVLRGGDARAARQRRGTRQLARWRCSKGATTTRREFACAIAMGR
jgi:hypothetical protein